MHLCYSCRMLTCGVALAFGVALTPGSVPVEAQAAGVQSPPQKPASQQQKPQPPALNPADLPVDIARIRQALARTPRLQFDELDRPVFRVEIFGEQPTIEEILGPDWATGPVKYGAMTHQEFLNLVTPKDVTGYAAFSNAEAATVATTSFLLQWTLQKAIAKFRETEDAREREAARQEVLEALEALEAARAKAKSGGK
jgi:hypothetical protein